MKVVDVSVSLHELTIAQDELLGLFMRGHHNLCGRECVVSVCCAGVGGQ